MSAVQSNGNTSEHAIDLLWGAEEIGKAIRRTPRQVNHMLSQGVLPAKKIGGRWCASVQALKASLAKEVA